MTIDVRTLTIVLSLINCLLVIALIVQYAVNPTYRGLGWWTLATALTAAGFGVNALREHPELGPAAIIAFNWLIVAGTTLYYVGALRFYGQRESRRLFIVFAIVYAATVVYLTLSAGGAIIRSVITVLTVGTLSLLIALKLLQHKPRALSTSTNFLAVVVLANAAFMYWRAIATFFDSSEAAAFVPTSIQITTYLGLIAITILWTFGFIILINQRLHAELRESEEKFRYMTENSSDVIWHLDRDFRFTYISPADERMRGFHRDEVIGATFWSLFKPEDVELITHNNSQRLSGEQQDAKTGVNRYELEQRCKDGSWVWTEVNVSPHKDGAGNLLGYHGVTRDISERKRLETELQRQATTDALTGAVNRRRFLGLAAGEIEQAHRAGHSLTLALLDLDNLKQINDTYGHAAGDHALVVLTNICNANLAAKAVFARLGGDEFALLLPLRDVVYARQLAEQLQRSLAAAVLDLDETPISLTFSMGIVELDDAVETLDTLLERADYTLYRAKAAGRGHIVSDPETDVVPG